MLWRQRFLLYYSRYCLFKLTVLINNSGHIILGSTIFELVAFAFLLSVFSLYWEKTVFDKSIFQTSAVNGVLSLIIIIIGLMHSSFQWVASHVLSPACPTGQAQLQLLEKCDCWMMTFPRSSTQDGSKNALRETTYTSTLSSQHWN